MEVVLYVICSACGGLVPLEGRIECFGANRVVTVLPETTGTCLGCNAQVKINELAKVRIKQYRIENG